MLQQNLFVGWGNENTSSGIKEEDVKFQMLEENYFFKLMIARLNKKQQ